jgi:hypothetical protein
MNKQYETIQIDKKQWRKHRFVMEEFIGRSLSKNELVHHIDGNRQNNDIENLKIVTRSEHKKLHPEIGKDTRLKQKYFFNREELVELRKRGLSTHKIAKKYKCSQPTILRALKKYGIN